MAVEMLGSEVHVHAFDLMQCGDESVDGVVAVHELVRDEEGGAEEETQEEKAENLLKEARLGEPTQVEHSHEPVDHQSQVERQSEQSRVFHLLCLGQCRIRPVFADHLIQDWKHREQVEEHKRRQSQTQVNKAVSGSDHHKEVVGYGGLHQEPVDRLFVRNSHRSYYKALGIGHRQYMSLSLLRPQPQLEHMYSHHLVGRVGKLTSPPTRCLCCNEETAHNPLSIDCKVSELAPFGTLFPLYFEFIFYISGLVFLCALFSLVNISLNLLGKTCGENLSFSCTSSVTNSLTGQEVNHLTIQATVNVLFLLVAVLYMEFMGCMIRQRRRDFYIPKEHEYAVLYKGSPSDSLADLHQKLKFLERKMEVTFGQPITILGAGLVMRVSGISTPTEMYLSNLQDEEGPRTQTRHVIHQTNPEMVQRVSTHFSGKAIVLFNKPLKSIHFDDPAVTSVSDASDIIWQNIGRQREESRKTVMLTLVGFLMVTTFLIILLIKKWIKKIQSEQHPFCVILLNLCVASIVAFFNSVEGIVIRACARRELYPFHSKFFRIIARRLSYVFFVNMVATTFFVNFLFFFEENTKGDQLLPIDYKGLVNDFFFLFLTNSYMSSLFNYFDIFYLIKLFKRRKLKHNPRNNPYSPEETKFILEGHPVDMGLRFGNVLKTLFFTAAISAFVPIGPILSLLGLFICYWTDKYLLLTRYTCRHELSGDFAEEMLDFSKYFVVLFAFSNFLVQLIPLNGRGGMDSPVSSWVDVYVSFSFFVMTVAYKFWFEDLKLLLRKPKLAKSDSDVMKDYSYSTVEGCFRTKYSDKMTILSMEGLLKRGSVESGGDGLAQGDQRLAETLKTSFLQSQFGEDTI